MSAAELAQILANHTDAEIFAAIALRAEIKAVQMQQRMMERSERRRTAPAWDAVGNPAPPIIPHEQRASRYIPRWLRLIVLAAPCAHCGAGNDLQVDHVMPVCRGGTSDPANLQPLCFVCNSRKRDHVV